MGPVRQNPIQRTVSLFICVCIALCTIVANNIAQNRPDSFPPYPPDNHHISDDVYLREGGGGCRSLGAKISGGRGRNSPANILIPLERHFIALYNFAADSFYIMKLCSRLFVMYTVLSKLSTRRQF